MPWGFKISLLSTLCNTKNSALANYNTKDKQNSKSLQRRLTGDEVEFRMLEWYAQSSGCFGFQATITAYRMIGSTKVKGRGIVGRQ